MAKKAIIIISLVKESEGKSNNGLEKEIFRVLSTPPPKIPVDEEHRESHRY